MLPKQGYVGTVGGRGGSEGGDYPAPRVHQGVGEEREHHREQRDRAKGRVRYLWNNRDYNFDTSRFIIPVVF